MSRAWPPQVLQRDWLAVGDGHQLYVAQYGRSDGIPVLYLHGGPGAGCSMDELRLFDLTVYRVIMLDQRGAGRSRPKGEIENNNLIKLLADIERIRVWLDIESWCLAGGSFGATLALLYSVLHPNRVKAQVLWGVFIPNDKGIAWLYGHRGAAQHFPEQYHQFSGQPLDNAALSLADLFKEFTGGLGHQNNAIRKQYVKRWLKWELALACPGAILSEYAVVENQALAKIECHFASNGYFSAADLLKEKVAQIKTDTLILQGEKDWVCHHSVLANFIRQHFSFTAEAESPFLDVIIVRQAHHVMADFKMFKAIASGIELMAAKVNKKSLS